jgi:prepilin-type N-terminal cleavage/methylation domain-containing protein
MKRKAFTLIELLVVIAIIAIFAAMVVGLGGGCSVSDGNRVGLVTKFSHKGILNKSWEGELVMGGARTKSDGNGNTSVVANVWQFSVLDGTLAAKIDKLQETGHRAKLVYHQTLMRNPYNRDTAYIIVEAVDLDAIPESK